MNNAIPLQISPELHLQIVALAKSTGKSETEVVREAVEAYAGQPMNPSAYDVAMRAGVIGCINDPTLPSDLSTNSQYMEGFGRE